MKRWAKDWRFLEVEIKLKKLNLSEYKTLLRVRKPLSKAINQYFFMRRGL